MTKPTLRPLTHLRKLCLALPETAEVEAWGEPTFRVRKKMFAMYANADGHHGAGRHTVWIKSTFENQDFLVRSQPERYFIPPYQGPYGWVGAYLDGDVDWDEVNGLLLDGYRLVAPQKLHALIG